MNDTGSHYKPNIIKDKFLKGFLSLVDQFLRIDCFKKTHILKILTLDQSLGTGVPRKSLFVGVI